MPNDTPWSGLEIGGTDTRRVDAGARWNWFWAVMPQKDAALVLRFGRMPEPVPDLPKLQSLEIRFQTLLGTPLLYIRLKDAAQIGLFETLCRDVIAASEGAETEADAIRRAIRRTFRWHFLLRGGHAQILSAEAQKGLVGELEVLKLLMAHFGVQPALKAWTGPSVAPKDFELDAGCIEVKARRGASQPFVRITSEHQLADVPGRHLWLAVLAVDQVQPPAGHTLTDHITAITDHIEREAPAAVMDWEQHLADAGYDACHDYAPWRWSASRPDFHMVADGFPRIASPVPAGVSEVSHALSLTACTPFRVDWNEVRAALSRETA